MIDLVYIVGPYSKHQDIELRYSLRSVDKFFGGIRNVHIIGHKPDFIHNVIHRHCEDIYGYPAHKERNILRKIIAACNTSDISEEFLCMDDDMIACGLSWAPGMPHGYDGTLTDYASKITGMYAGTISNTIAALEINGPGIKNYNIHAPWRIDKTLFPSVMAGFNFAQHNGLCIQSIYYNTIGVLGKKTTDLKINSAMSKENIYKSIRGRKFFSFGDRGLTDNMKEVLSELYPEPSKYERS